MKITDYLICAGDGVIHLSNEPCPVCQSWNRSKTLPTFLFSFEPSRHNRLLNIKLIDENKLLTVRNARICEQCLNIISIKKAGNVCGDCGSIHLQKLFKIKGD